MIRIGMTKAEEQAHSAEKARQVVREIATLGPDDRDILNIVSELILALEDRQAMLDIKTAVARHKSRLVLLEDVTTDSESSGE